jgi:hypothetical protein
MRIFYISIIIGLLPVFASAQSDYILIDSTLQVGVTLIDQGSTENSESCVLQRKNGDTIRYSPYQVTEYGFRNGKIFKSFNIQVPGQQKRYFLQVYRSSLVTIYFLKSKLHKKQFYYTLHSGDSLFAITKNKKEFRNLLTKAAGENSQLQKNIRFVKLNQAGVSAFMDYCNNYETNYFPRLSFGVISGFKNTTLSMLAIGENFARDIKIKGTAIPFGIFADFPINHGKTSVHPEIWFCQNTFSQNFDYNGISYSLKGNYSYVSFPLLIRYTFLRKYTSPYFQFGPVYARTGNDKTELSNLNASANDVHTTHDIFNKNMGGYTVGSGIVFHRKKTLSYSAEVRYSKLFNLGSSYEFNFLGDLTFGLGIIL